MGTEVMGNLLAVSPFSSDFSALKRIFRESRWNVDTCTTCAEALAHLKEQPVPVLMCEQALPDGNWKDILEKTRDQASPPSLIVASRLADERLWSEVLNLGGYDVLPKPFQPGEVSRVVTLAFFYWKNRRTMKAAGRH